MNHERRNAPRVTAGLPVDKISVAGVEHAALVRLDRGIQHTASYAILHNNQPSPSTARTTWREHHRQASDDRTPPQPADAACSHYAPPASAPLVPSAWREGVTKKGTTRTPLTRPDA